MNLGDQITRISVYAAFGNDVRGMADRSRIRDNLSRKKIGKSQSVRRRQRSSKRYALLMDSKPLVTYKEEGSIPTVYPGKKNRSSQGASKLVLTQQGASLRPR